MGCSNSYYGTAIKGDYFTKALQERQKARKYDRVNKEEIKKEEAKNREKEECKYN